MWTRLINFYKNQDKIVFFAVLIAVVVIISEIVLYITYYNILPNQIPLFYSRLWGDPQLGTKLQFLVIPILSLLLVLMNLIVSYYLHTKQVLIKRLLAMAGTFASLLLLITYLQIILIFI